MAFVLAHLSDPHFGPGFALPWQNLMNKRLLGAINWRTRRARLHADRAYECLAADLLVHRPDHIAVTGDVVNLGSSPEFSAVRPRLEALGSADRVSLVPGNHDLYVQGSTLAMRAELGAFLRGDEPSIETFPSLRRRGIIAIIGVNSALPTGPLMATGRVDAPQMARLDALLEALGRAGAFRIVLIHHPPYRGGARLARRLTNAQAFEHLIARHGAELILHGHNHRFSRHELATPNGICPVIGVGSASAMPGTAEHCAEYHLIRLDPAAAGARIQLERRRFEPATSRMVRLAELRIDA